MGPWFETICDLHNGRESIKARRYGMIEVRDGHLASVRLRPFPKFVTWPQIVLGERFHSRSCGNRCRLFYDQPRHFPNFLAVKFMVSTGDASLGTLRAALSVLDEIARIKGIDALLCDAHNFRISDRMLARCGWQPNKPSRWHRNFVKRFYGSYPPPLGRV